MSCLCSPLVLYRIIGVSYIVFLFVSVASSSNRDAAVLLRVKNSELQDPTGQLDDWLVSAPAAPCNWTGIICDPQTGDVVSIDLTSFTISGNFPMDFCRIKTLRSLNISDNVFGGVISAEAWSLCSHLHFLNLSSNVFVGGLPDLHVDFLNLTSLSLAFNNFTGDIPDSYGYRLPKLQELALFSNLLNGSIPEFLSNLTELTRLDIAINPFKPSPIPTGIGRLTKLQSLWMPSSNLHGSIPESIRHLVSLTNLDLSDNSLTGKIPESIGALTSVQQIELFRNRLSGEIPNSFSMLTSLVNFDASQNYLNGSIPDSLTSLALESLRLNDNYLEGKIPENLALNDKLSELSLFNNRLSGSLPANLGLNSGLVVLDVSGNLLEGPVPPNLCSKKQLDKLILFRNKFSGPIPPLYSDCSSLSYVRISNNELSGVVPVGFWGLPNLTILELYDNKLEGLISPTVSNAGGFVKLLVYGNQFSGELPDQICELKELVELDISKNQFSGALPPCITKLKNLEKFHAQENLITGQIPITVTTWTDLSDLNLSNNKLTGEIPKELGALPVLGYLDLSQNSISGEIPVELKNLGLRIFNLSNNRLQGRVPSCFDTEIFISSLMGNPGLCSTNLKPLPPCNRKVTPFVGGIILPVILFVVAAIMVGSVLWYLMEKPFAFGRSRKSWNSTAFQRIEFDEEEILASLTRDNLIATGGSGQVYRIKLKNGQVFAVKRLWEANRGPESEDLFKSEVDMLGKIRHANIVKLLFCFSGDGSKLLGYEFIENGSLGDVLHGEKGGILLDWPRRFRIAAETAEGLSYLHHDCVHAVVHRDVKSNNILLDEEFRPKVADFGLAKILKTTTDGGAPEASKIAGSYGYIAPEYAYTMRITEKSDVYSYGVILLELITGKRPVESCFGEGKDIVKWVNEVAISSPETNANGVFDLNHLIDPRLDHSTCNEKEVKLLLSMAFQCTSLLPTDRPSMRRVVELFKDHSTVRSK